jgi:hypothetical protein
MKLNTDYIVIFILICFLTSCNRDEFENFDGTNQLIDFTIQASIREDIGLATPANVEIILTNTSTGDIFKTLTNEEGQALFDNIDAGTYMATATLTWTSEEYEDNLGYTPNSDIVNFSGATENILVNNSSIETEIILFSGAIGDLLIKQIFYAGSDLVNGASFRDQFVEIYNNSNETLYADGLMFAQVFGSIYSTVYPYTLSNGQYDWTKSISNVVGDEANTNYTYADFVYRISGDGTTYPIIPGESIIIATTAVNHKAPLLDNNGNPLTVNDPSLTIDLSTADFEGYIGDYRIANGLEVASYDVQNLSVPDLEIIHYKSGKDMILNTLGTDSFIIFKNENVANLNKYFRPDETSGSTYMQIPISDVIDAVEINFNDPTDLYPRRLQTSLDGGYTYVPNGPYTSQSVIRKVASEVNGRKILQDTNNSTVDFTYLEQAEPKAFAQ